MRKLSMMLAAAALVVLPAVASAQTGTVTAKATIQATANFTGTPQDLNFGTITPDWATPTAKTIDVTDGTNAGYTEVTTNAKTVAVTSISITKPLTGLTYTGATIPFTLYCTAVENSATAPSSAVTTCSIPSLARTATSKTVWRLWFGGQITGANINNAVADSYSGTITVTLGTITA